MIERVGAWSRVYDVALRPLLTAPWIVAIAVAFLADLTAVAWVLAAPLLLVAAVVATTNWCLPSLMYGLMHGQRAGERPSAGTQLPARRLKT
jgi:uncharacterized protein DUF4395